MLGLARRRRRRVGMARRRVVRQRGRGLGDWFNKALDIGGRIAPIAAPFLLARMGRARRRPVRRQRGRGLMDVWRAVRDPVRRAATQIADKGFGLAAQHAINQKWVDKKTANDLRNSATTLRKKYLGFARRRAAPRRRMAGRAYSQLLF